jgi:hypothetical protein
MSGEYLDTVQIPNAVPEAVRSAKPHSISHFD